jgi:carbonyl reductase 1
MNCEGIWARIFGIVLMSVFLGGATALQGTGKVALVTGSNKGIGKEIARKLLCMPSTTVILGCRDKELGQNAVKELQRQAGTNSVVFQHLDLTDMASIESTRDVIEREYGQLDILVNNAAICFNDPTLYGKVPHTPFREQANITVQTNFFGSLAVTRHLLPLLRSAPSPRIINVASAAGRLRGSKEKVDEISSSSLKVERLEELMSDFVRDAEAGLHVERGWPNTCYGVSKMGLIALTRVLARNEPSIMINSVDPGFCATDQNANQGHVIAERGATTPALLAGLPPEQFVTGRYFLEEREIAW